MWFLLQMIVLFCSFGSLGLVCPTTPHPLYLSLTELHYQSATGELRMGVRMFTDDLEDALRQDLGTSLPVEGHWKAAKVQAAVQSYVLEKVQLKPGPTQWHLIEVKRQNDATWIAFAAQIEPGRKALLLQNRLLFEVFDTQRNIVRAYRDDKMQAHSLDQNHTEVALRW